MEKIKIIDDFLDKNELKDLKKKIKSIEWDYNLVSSNDEIVTNRFFISYKLLECSDYLKEKVEKEINELLIEKGESLNDKTYKKNKEYKVYPLELYAHTQFYGGDGAFHYDYNATDVYSFCLYLNDIDNNEIENANGELLIKIPEKKEIMAVDTKMNRGIIFPSRYIHKGNAYNHNYLNERICIAWKIKIK